MERWVRKSREESELAKRKNLESIARRAQRNEEKLRKAQAKVRMVFPPLTFFRKAQRTISSELKAR